MRLPSPRAALWVLCAVGLWAAPAHGDDLKDSIAQMEPPAPSAPALPQDPFWRSVHQLETALRGPNAGESRSETQYTADAPEEMSRRSRMILTLILSSLTGGTLVAVGLIHLAVGSWRDRLKATFGPAVVHTGPPPAAAGLAHIAPQLSASAVGVAMADAYQIVRKIGCGGMGVVYEAFDRMLQRRVAIKQLCQRVSSSPEYVENILHEARMVAALRHPNIMEIYSVVDSGSGIYLVFEYLDGLTVADHIRKRGRMPFSWSLGIMRSVASALDYAHKRDIIHRDLKPSNIMIDKEGIIKVIDFGVARRGDDMPDPGSSKDVAGTPPYMAPEQECGAARRESDVYAMGVTLYEMVTGRLPFSGQSSGLSQSKKDSAYLPPSVIAPDLPAHFDRVLSWALAPDPSKRWRSPGQFLRNLENLAQVG